MIKALLVDDEEQTLAAFKQNIQWKRCGIDHIFTAENMEAAICIYEMYKPDLLITDIEMPDGTGLQLWEKLQQMSDNLVCIFVTCHPEFDYMRRAIQLGSIDYVLKPIDYDELEGILKRLVEKIHSDKSNMNIKLSHTQIDSSLTYTETKLIADVREYIKQHLFEEITVQNLADHFNCSVSHLMRTFKKKTDCSIGKYITDERMAVAKQMLRDTELRINAIAEVIGYEDYSYFTRVFRKEVGVTPSEYRHEYWIANK